MHCTALHLLHCIALLSHNIRLRILLAGAPPSSVSHSTWVGGWQILARVQTLRQRERVSEFLNAFAWAPVEATHMLFASVSRSIGVRVPAC